MRVQVLVLFYVVCVTKAQVCQQFCLTASGEAPRHPPLIDGLQKWCVSFFAETSLCRTCAADTCTGPVQCPDSSCNAVSGVNYGGAFPRPYSALMCVGLCHYAIGNCIATLPEDHHDDQLKRLCALWHATGC